MNNDWQKEFQDKFCIEYPEGTVPRYILDKNKGTAETIEAFIQSELDKQEAEAKEKIEKAIDDFMAWNTTVSQPQIGKKFVMVNWYAVKDALLSQLSNNGGTE